MTPDSRSGYAVLAVWVTILGVFLMVAPDDWYGPSWSYFARQGELIVPAGGFGMGAALVLVGVLQMLAVWGSRWRMLSLALALSGFVFMTAGLLLADEGLSGHQGLMEAPFMIFLAVHKLVASVNASRLATWPREPPS